MATRATVTGKSLGWGGLELDHDDVVGPAVPHRMTGGLSLLISCWKPATYGCFEFYRDYNNLPWVPERPCLDLAVLRTVGLFEFLFLLL